MPFDVVITADDREIEALCREYWAVDADLKFPTRVADLAERYHLKTNEVSRVVREHSFARSTETRCAGCDEGIEFRSRSDFQQRRGWYEKWNRPYVCDRCAAENARLQAREAEERQQGQAAAVRHRFALESGGSFDVDALDFEHATALLSVIRVGASEDLSVISPAETWASPLTSTADLDSETLKDLFDSGVLAISSSSPADAFEWDGLDPVRFYRLRVSWQVRDADAAVPIALARTELERCFRERDWPEHWRDGVHPLWLKLALHECLRYLELGLADHGLQKRIGEKTVAVVTNALHDFSVGQVFCFIWRAVRDAAAYYMRGGVAKQQAANTVVRAIERFAEQALANAWDIKSFHRDWRAPEPVMAHTFATLVTGLGDAYWTSRPHAIDAPAAPTPRAAIPGVR